MVTKLLWPDLVGSFNLFKQKLLCLTFSLASPQKKKIYSRTQRNQHFNWNHSWCKMKNKNNKFDYYSTRKTTLSWTRWDLGVTELFTYHNIADSSFYFKLLNHLLEDLLYLTPFQKNFWTSIINVLYLEDASNKLFSTR